MKTSHNPKKLMVASNEELSTLYDQCKIGIDNGYYTEDIRKEIAYRQMIDEWNAYEELMESKDDGGCGHDQNDNYYND